MSAKKKKGGGGGARAPTPTKKKKNRRNKKHHTKTQSTLRSPDIHPQEDGTQVIDGAAYIREVNKALGWHLPCDGPKTLNGLITEALESIPDSAVCLKIGPYRLEILQSSENRVK